MFNTHFPCYSEILMRKLKQIPKMLICMICLLKNKLLWRNVCYQECPSTKQIEGMYVEDNSHVNEN